MAIRGTSPRYLAISKKFNGDLSYRVGEARELTLKGSLASPTSLLRMVPDIPCFKKSCDVNVFSIYHNWSLKPQNIFSVQ
jgi:hypothetical protein